MGKAKASAPILGNFTTMFPRYSVEQRSAIRWLAQTHAQADGAGESEAEFIQKIFQRYAIKETRILRRYSECDDAFNSDWNKNRIYRIGVRGRGADTYTRNLCFAEHALRVLEAFYPRHSLLPEHLIHVTCTGYVSPSAAQLLVAKYNANTAITHAYHMGCYASLPAIRIAAALCEKEGRIDIVHNEICSLHMDPTDHAPEQIVVQSLFADGHVKYSVGASEGLRILSIREEIVPGSEKDMTWVPGAYGMQMTLSREVPAKIAAVLRGFLVRICEAVGASLDEIHKSAVFAVHPGGPKIIDSVRDVLELREEQVRVSRKVLFERGNMSSATLPHVWKEILDENLPRGPRVVSLAFGPGLTVFGSLFEIV